MVNTADSRLSWTGRGMWREQYFIHLGLLLSSQLPSKFYFLLLQKYYVDAILLATDNFFVFKV